MEVCGRAASRRELCVDACAAPGVQDLAWLCGNQVATHGRLASRETGSHAKTAVINSGRFALRKFSNYYTIY